MISNFRIDISLIKFLVKSFINVLHLKILNLIQELYRVVVDKKFTSKNIILFLSKKVAHNCTFFILITR